MEIAAKEPWWELAEKAAVEPDASKLLLLMVEINRLLEADRADKMSRHKPVDDIERRIPKS